MKNIAAVILTLSFIPYAMAWPQKYPDVLVDTAHPQTTQVEELLALKCNESNILSCVIAEIDQIESGLVRVVMADHSQIFMPGPAEDCCNCLQEAANQKNEPLTQKFSDEASALNFRVRPDDQGKYIDLFASFDREIHGQIEFRSDGGNVVLTLPFYHTEVLDERIDVSNLKRGKYDVVIRIGAYTLEKQLSI